VRSREPLQMTGGRTWIRTRDLFLISQAGRASEIGTRRTSQSGNHKKCSDFQANCRAGFPRSPDESGTPRVPRRLDYLGTKQLPAAS